VITLNARLRPLDRARYEDLLEHLLAKKHPGSEITGGGTLLSPAREPLYCDIEIDANLDSGLETLANVMVELLEVAGAPKGSRIEVDDAPPAEFGVTEGLAIYLNGTDLPHEVYASNDVNDLITAIHDRLGDAGRICSFWQGHRETALYLYGPSAPRMINLLTDVLAQYPLAQQCRVVELPEALPQLR
jgi:hypothetical protein